MTLTEQQTDKATREDKSALSFDYVRVSITKVPCSCQAKVLSDEATTGSRYPGICDKPQPSTRKNCTLPAEKLGIRWGMITVIGIAGSMRWPSHTHAMLEVTLGAARESGSRVELIDVHTLDLPLYDPRVRDAPPVVTELRERMADAHAYIIGSPEYHGGMSGALKNLLDYLYPEVNGKLFGIVVATGSDDGTSALAQLRTTIHAMHAWCLPYAATAGSDDFDESAHLASARVRETLLRLGRDVAIYGELLYERFARDRVLGGGVQLGFAPWHARE